MNSNSNNNNNNNNNNNDNDLGRRLSLKGPLFQRVSVLIQRYNAVPFRGSFVDEDDDVSG